MDVQPGWRVGSDDDVDRFELIDHVHDGGEGNLWQARTVGESDELWAIKILHRRHFRGDPQRIERWVARWQNSLRKTAQLRDVPGIEPVRMAFAGPVPHPAGEAGAERTVYMVSRWVNGGVDLDRHVKDPPPTLDEALRLLEQIAATVDGLAQAKLFHRDIAADNVLVDANGRVWLIDFAFLARAERTPGSLQPSKGGWTAPEARQGAWSEASDRYSVGALAVFLLTAERPRLANAQDAALSALRAAGFGAAVADHVVALLAHAPEDRPAPLTQWVDALRELAEAEQAEGRFVDVAISVSSGRTPKLWASSVRETAFLLFAPTSQWVLEPVDGLPPARAIAAASGGDGCVRVFGLATDGGVWARSGDDVPERLGRGSPDGGLAAALLGDGSVLCAWLDRDREELLTVREWVTGERKQTVHEAAAAARVLAVVETERAAPVVLAAFDRTLAVTDLQEPGWTDVLDIPVLAADLCVNDAGELQCISAVDGGRQLHSSECNAGTWEPPDPVPSPGVAYDVACLGHRGGLTVATACDDGLWLTRRAAGEDWARWQRLRSGAATRVVLAEVGRFRLQVAAIIDGMPVTAIERYDGVWPEAFTLDHA